MLVKQIYLKLFFEMLTRLSTDKGVIINSCIWFRVVRLELIVKSRYLIVV